MCKMFLNIYSSIETRIKTLQSQTLQTLCSFTLSGNSTNKIPAKYNDSLLIQWCETSHSSWSFIERTLGYILVSAGTVGGDYAR